ncbi:uncharacterized protein LOC114909075 [Scleropages formosus]|uniref:uncharacterized protein LOC114909075 n=1 Tax=Scleropages formosus TaxID=113540 RepID=UPI0010FA8D14|nr:uncharacterized protein LOC114909075 [Scleropages formosus]
MSCQSRRDPMDVQISVHIGGSNVRHSEEQGNAGANRPDPGVYNCSSRRCDCCRYMKANIKQFESTGTKKSYSIREVLSCDTKSVIYVIECQKCREQFVEKTVGPLKKRFSTVKNSVLKKQYRPVSRHFNSDGHSLDDLRIFPIEQVSDIEKLKERAEYWHEELVLLDVEVDELQYECEAMEEQGRVPGEPVQPSRASAGDSSTSVAPKRRNEEEGGVSPAKKRRKKKKRILFSREIEQLLSTCEDAMKNCRETIADISMKLQNVSCTESMGFLETFQ